MTKTENKNQQLTFKVVVRGNCICYMGKVPKSY